MDPLLLEHGKTASVAIARHHPVRVVVGQPAFGRRDVDAHAGEAAGGGGADGIGLVDLARVDAAEHRDGEIRHVAEGGHRLTVRRVHVGQEVVQAVRRGVRVGRDHDVVPTLRRCGRGDRSLAHPTPSLSVTRTLLPPFAGARRGHSAGGRREPVRK